MQFSLSCLFIRKILISHYKFKLLALNKILLDKVVFYLFGEKMVRWIKRFKIEKKYFLLFVFLFCLECSDIRSISTGEGWRPASDRSTTIVKYFIYIFLFLNISVFIMLACLLTLKRDIIIFFNK